MTTAAQIGIHLLGPGGLTIDGVESGHVLKASLKIPSASVPGLTGRYGDSSVAEFSSPQNPMFEVEFAQDDEIVLPVITGFSVENKEKLPAEYGVKPPTLVMAC